MPTAAAPVHFVIVPLIVWSATAFSATAQVRMNLRNTMQIDGLQERLVADERCWPIESNAFAPGDVDGDGDLDLLVAVNWGTSRVWLNDGSGGFHRFVSLTSPSYSGTRCALFDADGDGDLDAFIAGGATSYAGSSVSSLFLNNGTGAFTLSPTIPSGPVETTGLSVSDLDGDGDLDILLGLTGSQPPFVQFWRNVGNATFLDHTSMVPPFAAPGGQVSTTTADVNGDGLPDFLGVDSSTSTPFVFVSGLGNATATWFEPHALEDLTVGFVHHACAAFDVDGDGDPDFVTGGSEQRGASSTTVGVPPRVFLNIGGQRFRDAGRSALPMAWSTADAIAAGDVDGDGDVDLVSGGVWRQDAAGNFLPVAGGMPTGPLNTAALKLADVDGDGDLDLIRIHGRGRLFPGYVGQHRLALNDGLGSFTDVTATRMPPAPSGGASCDVGDVDGDGDLDIVIGSYSPGFGGPGVPLQLFVNNGSGFFSDEPSRMPTTLFESGYVALHDFDGDNDLDLVVAQDSSHPTSRPSLYFANDGAGVFSDESAARLPTGPWTELSVLDLDNDGDLDLAQSGADLINDGAGYFTAVGAPGSRIAVADFDEDGSPDSVQDLGVQTSASRVVVAGRTVVEDKNSSGHFVLPVDLDRDGDLDLVVAAVGVWVYFDAQLLRIELVYNLRRDLRVMNHPRVGQPYRLQLRATGGPTAAFLACAGAVLSPRLEIPGIGALLLDPAAMIPVATVAIPNADSAVEPGIMIPNQPALQGLVISCQALMITGTDVRLTNGMSHTIER
ncbi:MAG: VCBS repeat-containing protein [Planctomycetes bacterium]|jgi:hypothetical protein|nr:VCBS repeat-containing protein [Planctomycetota bacterium]